MSLLTCYYGIHLAIKIRWKTVPWIMCSIKKISRTLVGIETIKLIIGRVVTRDAETVWFLNSGWLGTIISTKQKDYRYDSEADPRRTQRVDRSGCHNQPNITVGLLLSVAVLLYVIRCDTVPPPHAFLQLSDSTSQSISFHPFHYNRWPLLILLRFCFLWSALNFETGCLFEFSCCV